MYATVHVSPADDAAALHESSLLMPSMMRHACRTGALEHDIRCHELAGKKFVLARQQALAEAESQDEQAHLARQYWRWEASWCSTVSSFSALMGTLQQESRDACRSDSESVQCASRRYGSSISGRPCEMHGGVQKDCFNKA